MESGNLANDKAVLVIDREFHAPRNLVFKTFSQAEHLAQWWGPVGYRLSVISLDFRPGGMFHYKMELAGTTMWARFIYGNIRKPERIEFVLSFSDENGGVTRAPFFDGNWPLEIFNQLTFTEKEDKTMLQLRSYPLNPTTVEMETFVKERASFNGGMSATLDQLEKWLQQLSTNKGR